MTLKFKLARAATRAATVAGSGSESKSPWHRRTVMMPVAVTVPGGPGGGGTLKGPDSEPGSSGSESHRDCQ